MATKKPKLVSVRNGWALVDPVSLETLEQLREKATGGTWEHRPLNVEFVTPGLIAAIGADDQGRRTTTFIAELLAPAGHASADYICALVNAAPWLLQQARAAEGLRQQIATFQDWLKGERIPAGTLNPAYNDTIADNTINRVQVRFERVLAALPAETPKEG